MSQADRSSDYQQRRHRNKEEYIEVDKPTLGNNSAIPMMVDPAWLIVIGSYILVNGAAAVLDGDHGLDWGGVDYEIFQKGRFAELYRLGGKN